MMTTMTSSAMHGIKRTKNIVNENNYISPNKYESLVIDHSDDDNDDIICDAWNKKNKKYSQ